MALESGEPNKAEKFLRKEQGKYSLEKYNNAPEAALTPDEKNFVDETMHKFSEVYEKNRPASASKMLRALVSPYVWKLAFDTAKIMPLLKKDADSKEGQVALAQLEAEDLNAEYERKLAALQKAANELADFIERANGRASDKTTE